MALKQSTQVTNKLPPISADGYEPTVLVGDFTVPAGLALNDVVEMVILPAGYVPVDVVAYVEDTDSNGAPAMTLDLGVLSGDGGVVDNARTCGSEAIAGATTAQTGGVIRPTKKDWGLIAPTTNDRGIGFKVAAAAATLTVGAKWRVNVLARPQLAGV